MSRDRALARGQDAALAGMVDACTIRRRLGESTDPATGVIGVSWSALYAGQCRVQQSLAQAEQHDVGEDYVLQLRLVLQLPVSVTGLDVNDEVTLTVSRDADLIGRVFLIRDLFHKTDMTARRVGVTERTD